MDERRTRGREERKIGRGRDNNRIDRRLHCCRDNSYSIIIIIIVVVMMMNECKNEWTNEEKGSSNPFQLVGRLVL